MNKDMSKTIYSTQISLLKVNLPNAKQDPRKTMRPTATYIM
jgi:hypothetical protein